MIAPHQTKSSRSTVGSIKDGDSQRDTKSSTRSRAPMARAPTTDAEASGRHGTADLAAFLLATGPVDDWSPQEYLYSPEAAPRKRKSERVLSKLLKKSTQTFRSKDDASHEKRRSRSSTADGAQHEGNADETRSARQSQYISRTHKPNAKSLSNAKPHLPLVSSAVANGATAIATPKKPVPRDFDEDVQKTKHKGNAVNTDPVSQSNASTTAKGGPSQPDVLYVHDGNVFEHVSIENMPKRVSSRTISELTNRSTKTTSRREAPGVIAIPVQVKSAELAHTSQSALLQHSSSQETDEKTLASSASPLKKLSHSDDPKTSTVLEESAEDRFEKELPAFERARKPLDLYKTDRVAKSFVSTNAATISTQKDAESELAFDPPDDVKVFVERVEPSRRMMAKTTSMPNLRDNDLELANGGEDTEREDEPIGLGLQSNEAEKGQDYATAMRQLESTRAVIMQAPGRKAKRLSTKGVGVGTSSTEDLSDALQRAEERANIAESTAQVERTRCRQLALRSLHFLRQHKCQVHNALSSSNGSAPPTPKEAGEVSVSNEDTASGGGHGATSLASDDSHSNDLRRLDKLINDLSDYLEQGRRLPPTPKSAAFETTSILKKAATPVQDAGSKTNGSRAKREVRRVASLRFVPPETSESGHAHKRSASNNNILPSEPRLTEASLYARQVKASL